MIKVIDEPIRIKCPNCKVSLEYLPSEQIKRQIGNTNKYLCIDCPICEKEIITNVC